MALLESISSARIKVEADPQSGEEFLERQVELSERLWRRLDAMSSDEESRWEDELAAILKGSGPGGP